MMNEEERQLMPDQYQHFKEKLKDQYKKYMIVLKVVATLAILSLILVAYSMLSNDSQQASEMKSQNNQIAKKNIQASTENSKLEQQIAGLDIQSLSLQANITKLQTEVNNTNKQIRDIQANIRENCDTMKQRLRLNQTNLNALQISVLPTPLDANTPIIISLNISGNNISLFSDNYLPNAGALDITNNPINNFSNNNLPSLTNLFMNQQSSIKQFNNNTLPQIKSLNLAQYGIFSFQGNIFTQLYYLNLEQNNIIQISNYDIPALQSIALQGNPLQIIQNNNFPQLANFIGLESVNSLIQVTNNRLGIKAISLNSNNETIKFQNNILTELTFLQLNQCKYDYSKLSLNTMPLIMKLFISNSNLSNFQYFPQFRLFMLISIQKTNIKSFSNHEYPNLRSLILKQVSELIMFENNQFPTLEDLLISGSTKLADVCKGNLILNLKSAYFDGLSSLGDLSCFSKLKQLKVLILFAHSLTAFDSFQLPLLEKLIIRFGPLNSFHNNNLPSLTFLSIQINSTSSFNLPSYKNLRILQIFGSLKIFSNYQISSLEQLTLSVNNEATQFVNNTLVNLQEIAFIQFKSMPNLAVNSFGSLTRLRIEHCTSLFTSKDIFHSSLVQIMISQSNLSEFTNQNMLKLQKLQIVNGNLGTFSGNSLPNVIQMSLAQNKLIEFNCPNENSLNSIEYLALNGNKLTDTIASKLIACNMEKLHDLNLQNNDIKDKQSIRQQLAVKYPRTDIHL